LAFFRYSLHLSLSSHLRSLSIRSPFPLLFSFSFCLLLAVIHQSLRVPLYRLPRLLMNRSLIPSLVRFLPLLPASCSEPLITLLPYDRQPCMVMNRPQSHPVFPVPPASCSEPSARPSPRLPLVCQRFMVMNHSPVLSS